MVHYIGPKLIPLVSLAVFWYFVSLYGVGSICLCQCLYLCLCLCMCMPQVNFDFRTSCYHVTVYSGLQKMTKTTRKIIKCSFFSPFCKLKEKKNFFIRYSRSIEIPWNVPTENTEWDFNHCNSCYSFILSMNYHLWKYESQKIDEFILCTLYSRFMFEN